MGLHNFFKNFRRGLLKERQDDDRSCTSEQSKCPRLADSDDEDIEEDIAEEEYDDAIEELQGKYFVHY